MSAPLNVVLISCSLLGFRHGFDYDHVAAITDIAGMQAGAVRTMRLSLMYALGHAATVALLGSIVIGFQLALPPSIDRLAERFVGFTLIILALYVFNTLIRDGGRRMPKSRAALILSASGWLRRRVQRWLGNETTEHEVAEREVTASGCLLIGVIHGLGAETPSQLALFLMALNLGGVQRGFTGLGFFLAGLIIMNTLMAASVAGIFAVAYRRRGLDVFFGSLTALYSLVIGMVFLFGYSDHLKNITG